MGGYGTWALATSYPHRFAALAPVCGGGDPTKISAVHKNLSAWIFHGDRDFIVMVKEAEAMKEALERVGGEVRWTVEKGLDHCSIVGFAYNGPELYEWFLTKERKFSGNLAEI